MVTLQSSCSCFLPEIPKRVWRGLFLHLACSYSTKLFPGIATHFICNAYTSPLSNQCKGFLQKLLRVLDNTIHTLQKIKSGRLEYQQEPSLSTKDEVRSLSSQHDISAISQVNSAQNCSKRDFHTMPSGEKMWLFFPEVRNMEARWAKSRLRWAVCIKYLNIKGLLFSWGH